MEKGNKNNYSKIMTKGLNKEKFIIIEDHENLISANKNTPINMYYKFENRKISIDEYDNLNNLLKMGQKKEIVYE